MTNLDAPIDDLYITVSNLTGARLRNVGYRLVDRKPANRAEVARLVDKLLDLDHHAAARASYIAHVDPVEAAALRKLADRAARRRTHLADFL